MTAHSSLKPCNLDLDSKDRHALSRGVCVCVCGSLCVRVCMFLTSADSYSILWCSNYLMTILR